MFPRQLILLWSQVSSRKKFPFLSPADDLRQIINFGWGSIMYIGITLRRYKSVKEVGKIKMSVAVVAYYQRMQICQAEYFRQLLKPVT
ncbi:hypothetical protein AgCh_024658 [Apium graveolens]